MSKLKLNKNGIPILDSPKESNKLKKQCPPGEHEFIPINGYFEKPLEKTTYICSICGEKEVSEEISDSDED